IDQVVGRVAELRWTALLCGPACRRVHWRDQLGSDRCRASERCIVEYLEILANRAARGVGGKLCVPALAVGIGANEAAIDGKAFTTDQALGEAALDGRLEQAAQQIAIAEAAVTVLGEGRVIGHCAVQTE